MSETKQKKPIALTESLELFETSDCNIRLTCDTFRHKDKDKAHSLMNLQHNFRQAPHQPMPDGSPSALYPFNMRGARQIYGRVT